MTTNNSSPEQQLALREVADELGVHYMTAYRYVRLGLLDARQVGRSWVVLRSDLEDFKARDFKAEGGGRTPSPRGEADWSARLRRRLLVGDEVGAWSTVEAALASGSTVPDVYEWILVPAMRDIGNMWHDGTIDVSAEHAASRVANRIIARLGPRVSVRGVKRGTVVLGSTATELHSLPLSIAADLFRAARFSVLDLGANLPPASFAEAVSEADSLVAVAVGVTTTGQDEAVRSTLAAIRGVSDRPVIVGGQGIDATTALQLGADRYAATAQDAIALLDEILGES